MADTQISPQHRGFNFRTVILHSLQTVHGCQPCFCNSSFVGLYIDPDLPSRFRGQTSAFGEFFKRIEKILQLCLKIFQRFMRAWTRSENVLGRNRQLEEKRCIKNNQSLVRNLSSIIIYIIMIAIVLVSGENDVSAVTLIMYPHRA